MAICYDECFVYNTLDDAAYLLSYCFHPYHDYNGRLMNDNAGVIYNQFMTVELSSLELCAKPSNPPQYP